MWEIENSLITSGKRIICGVDEAGRGPLAGPVYAAAVILPVGINIDGLNDSKKLTPKNRERLFETITDVAASFGIASASVEEINELNILGATFIAMNRAIAMLEPAPDIAIIDGNLNKGIECESICIIGGDEKSATVAAASILAKVSRDRYMIKLAGSYPEYGFERHKGYGTKSHIDAIAAHGQSDIHRAKFVKTVLGKRQNGR